MEGPRTLCFLQGLETARMGFRVGANDVSAVILNDGGEETMSQWIQVRRYQDEEVDELVTINFSNATAIRSYEGRAVVETARDTIFLDISYDDLIVKLDSLLCIHALG